MAVISANVQYNRGEHKLLDYTSLQNSYLTALDWTNDPNSNAAIGQYIYISNDWTDEETGKLYPKGPYIVESIKTIDASTKEVLTSGKLTPLSQSIAGEQDLSSVVADLKTTVGNDASGLVADVAKLQTDVANLPETFVTDVKDASGNSVVGVDGVVTLGDYATKEDVSTGLAAKANASEVYTKGEADDKYVAKEDNKGLSANDFTTELKTKLEEIKEIKSVGDNLNVDASGKLTVSIPEVEVPFQSVAINDKVLTLDDNGVLSSDIKLTIDTEADAEGKKYIRLTGKNREQLGKIDIADFVVDGMLESVAEKENDPTTLVFTWNEASGKTTTTEINFGKYVDTYAADGSTLVLDADNKTFSVKEGVFALDASVDASLSLKANVADVYNSSTVDGLLGAKVDTSVYDSKVSEIDGSISTIKSELANKVDTSTFESALGGKVDVSAGCSLVDDDLISKLDNMEYIKSIEGDLTFTEEGVLSVDLSSYATIADTSANFVQKEVNKGLSTNDFTTELKTKLEEIKEIKSVGDNLNVDASGNLTVDLSNFVQKEVNKGLSTNDFTTELKTKLEEIKEIKSVGDNLNVDASGNLTVDLSSKLDANVTVNGASFINGDAKLDAADIKLNAVIGKKEVDGVQTDRYTTDNNIQYVLNDIDTRIVAINTTIDNVTGGGVIADITAGDGINVDKTTKINPTVSVKVDESTIKIDSNDKVSLKVSKEDKQALEVKDDGVYIQDMRSYWDTI